MATASEQRQALTGLTALAQRDLRAAVREVEGLPADRVAAPLAAILEALGTDYGLAAGALAADWYDEVRDQAGAGKRFSAEPAAPVQSARWAALARWGVDPLFGESPDWASTTTRLSGGLQRTIADRHRLTVVDNSLRDPSASGWRRVGVGDNCGFCRMLIDRGHVYTEASVTFRSHDHCNCAASPEFADNVVKVSAEPFKQSQKRRSDATKAKDNRRAREFIAENYGD